MSLTLEIDYREHHLIDLIKSKKDNLITLNLHVGDIIIKDNEDIILVIERKCISDFCSSISDGRYREQKERLVELNCEKMYIIEGNINCDMKNTLQSSIINMLIRDRLLVFRTENLQETCDTVLSLYDKYSKGTFTKKVNSSHVIRKCDKMNNNIFVNQLCCITGMSNTIAKKINLIYPSMKSLSDATIDSLKIIQITPIRKLGLKLAEKIIKSFNDGIL